MGGHRTNVNIAAGVLSVLVMSMAFAHRYVEDNDMRWRLYDTHQALSLLFLSGWLFLYIHPKDALMKAFALVWALDSLKECYDVWHDGNSNDWMGLVVQYAVISLIALPGLFSAWNIRRMEKRFSSPVKGVTVYVVCYAPQRMATWWHFTTGVAPGSMHIAFINGDNALVFRFRKELIESKVKVSDMKGAMFIPVYLDEKVVPGLIRSFRAKAGTRWSLLRNCSKVIFGVLYSAGVPRSRCTVLPIVPLLKLCFDDPRSAVCKNENSD